MPPLMKDLNATSRCAAFYRAERLESQGLCGGQYAYILRICRRPGITQDELSRSLCVHKSSVARQVSVLEQNGFIERRAREDDRRARCLYPTEKAMAVLPLIRDTLSSWNAFLTEDFTEEEKDVLSSLMKRIREKAETFFRMATEDEEDDLE